MRLLPIAAAVAITAATACGTTTPPASAPVETTAETTTESGARATGEHEQCQTAGLRVHTGPGNTDMQGAHVPLRFTNTASQPCTLHGAPGVSYVTGEGGNQIGLPATRDTDGPVVTIGPGETASAGLFLSSAPLKTPGCDQVPVGGLRVFPPNTTEPVFVEHGATACAPPVDGPFLEVGPVEPGADNTGV